MLKLAVLLSVCWLVKVESLAVTSSADFLVDQWLDHSSILLNDTNNENHAIEGLSFTTNSLIFLMNETINIKTDLGLIKGINYIQRHSAVQVTDKYTSDVVSITVQFDVLFPNSISIHYPYMYITGQGIDISYQGVDITANDYSPTAIPLTITLAYSPVSHQCTTSFKLYFNDDYNLKASVSIPAKPFILNQDIKENLYKSINNVFQNHFSTFINYENICQKLLNLL